MFKTFEAVTTASAVACVLAAVTTAQALGQPQAQPQSPSQPQPQSQRQAQDRAEMDRDVQELRQYRLSMPKVKQMAAATLAFAREVEKDPTAMAARRLDKEIEALENKGTLSETEAKRLEELRATRQAQDQADGDDETPKTLADMSRRIEKEPRLDTAIKGAGLTTREYSLLTLSFFQAMFAHMMQKGGGLKEMPKEVPAENVQFVQQHEAELMQIFSALQAHDKD